MQRAGQHLNNQMYNKGWLYNRCSLKEFYRKCSLHSAAWDFAAEQTGRVIVTLNDLSLQLGDVAQSIMLCM